MAEGTYLTKENNKQVNDIKMQVIGKLEEVHDTVKRTETFSVREFVLEITSQSSQYSEHVLFQLTNNRTSLIDQFQIGQEVAVDFDLQGRKWTNPEGRVVFFNRLNAWRITPFTQGQNMGYQQPQGGYPQQGFQQPMPQYQQPMQQAPAPQQAQAPSAPTAGGDDDLPF